MSATVRHASHVLARLLRCCGADAAALETAQWRVRADRSGRTLAAEGQSSDDARGTAGSSLTLTWLDAAGDPMSAIEWLTREPGLALPPRASVTPPLSDLQRTVLARIASGARSDEVAEELGYSVYYVKDLMAVARQRLGAADRTHAAALAVAHGLIEAREDGTFLPVLSNATIKLPPQEGSAEVKNAVD